MSNTRYLLLTDEKNNGEVIKQVGRTFFSFENFEWKKRGLSAGYFLPEALEYECYKEISEDEAMKIIKSKSPPTDDSAYLC